MPRIPPVVDWLVKYHHPTETRNLTVKASTRTLARLAVHDAERQAGWWQPDVDTFLTWFRGVTKITVTRKRNRTFS